MDIDNDGKLDLLSGSYSRSGADTMAGLFQVLNGMGKGQFASAKALAGNDGEPLLIPFEGDDAVTQAICTRPSAIDWDGDEDLDLVVGNFAGSFYLFEGEGDGKFAPKPEKMMAGDAALKLANGDYHSDPFPIDWDGDGDIDLLSGGANGGVQWAENNAGKGQQPSFGGFKTLLAPAMQIEYGDLLNEKDLVGPAGSTRVWADDVNGDGKLDLLVGDSVTLIAKAEGLTDEEFKKKQDDWEKKQAAIMKDFNSGDEKKVEAAQVKFQELFEAREQFISEDMTGFVWLYVQK